MKEINLNDFQFNLVFSSLEKIKYFKEKLQEIEVHQNNIISLICNDKKVEFNGFAEIDIKNKKLIIKNGQPNSNDSK